MNTFIADPVTEENKQSNFRWLMDNGYRGNETHAPKHYGCSYVAGLILSQSPK